MRPGIVPTTNTTPPVVYDQASSIERLARCGERVPRWTTHADPARPAGGPPAPVDLLDLDRLAMGIRLTLDGVTLPLARSAAVFVRDRQFTAFGFARLDDCARERFDRSGRWMRDRAALGEAIERFPTLAAAIAGTDGRAPLGTVAALLIARVADEASLAGWVDLARSCTVRTLRAAVARARGEGTTTAPVPATGDEEVAGHGHHDRPEDAPAGEDTTGEGGDIRGGGATAGGPTAVDDTTDDDAPDLMAVRVPVPEPVRRAFDEALDLFRAVEGRESGAADFVEALTAETAAGGAPFEVDAAPVRRGPTIEQVEAVMARATSHWRDLRGGGPPQLPTESEAGADGEVDMCHADLRALLAAAGRLAHDPRSDPETVDRRLRALLRIAAELERRLGEILADLAGRGAWARLLFADVGHYAEERLGLSRTSASDRTRLARALRSRPILRRAVAEGAVGCEAALLVLRVLGPAPVDPAAEEAWVARAVEVSIKRLRDEVRAATTGWDAGRPADLGAAPAAGVAPDSGAVPVPGAGPASGGRPASAPAPGHPPRPGPLDDDAWHASLRREPGRSRRRVLRAGLEAIGGFGPARATGPDDPDVFQLDAAPLPAGPDVFLRLRLTQEAAARFAMAIEAARAARAREAAAVPWDAPFECSGVVPSLLAARMHTARSRRVPAWVGLLALLEDFVFTWDPVETPPARAADATYNRDGWRCAAPACTSRRNLEGHHVLYRSHGGNDEPDNVVTLCRFHHQRGEHDGLTRVRGEAPLGLIWRLGRAECGTWWRNERRLPPPSETPAPVGGG